MTPTTLTILDSYLKDLPEELIIKAIEIASEQNKKNLAYIKGILNSWINKGFKTLSDIENEKNNRRTIDDTEKRVMEALYGR